MEENEGSPKRCFGSLSLPGGVLVWSTRRIPCLNKFDPLPGLDCHVSLESVLVAIVPSELPFGSFVVQDLVEMEE
jgi:hypothetical protein